MWSSGGAGDGHGEATGGVVGDKDEGPVGRQKEMEEPRVGDAFGEGGGRIMQWILYDFFER